MAFGRGPNIVTDGLVLCLDAASHKSYPGSGTTWYDLSGNGNNGTLTNGPTFDSGNNGSLSFDGVNDYVSVNDTVGNFGIQNFTINVIFKTTTTLSPRTFFAKSIGGSPTVEYGWLVNQASSGELGFATNSTTSSFGSTGTYSIKTLNGGINDGDWKIVSIIGDKSQSDVIIYINGIQQTLQTYVGKSSFSSVGSITNNYSLRVGAESDDVTPLPINGNISSVGIYNRALTPEEVLQNYNATKSRFGL